MDVVYFKKSESRVTRVVTKDRIEIEVPGYPQRFLLDLGDPASVGPAPLTTLSAREGSTGDLYLSPAYLSAHGIVGDIDTIKWPDRGGGSYGETWRAWSALRSFQEAGAVAESLRAIRAEMKGGSLSACGSLFAAGELERGRAELARLAQGDSKAVRSARPLLAPGHRSDARQVASVLQAAVVGILAGAC